MADHADSKNEGTLLRGRQVLAYAFFAAAIFALLSIFSYHWRQISALSFPPASGMSNLIGPLGAWFSFLMVMTAGVGCVLFPFWLVSVGLGLLFIRERSVRSLVGWSFLLWLCIVSLLDLWVVGVDALHGKFNFADFGGLYGRFITRGLLVGMLSPTGAALAVVFAVCTVSVMLAGPANLKRMFHVLARMLPGSGAARQEAAAAAIGGGGKPVPTPRYGTKKSALNGGVADAASSSIGASKPPSPAAPVAQARPAASDRKPARESMHDVRGAGKAADVGRDVPAPLAPRAALAGEHSHYTLPPLSLLDNPVVETRNTPIDTEATSIILVDTLNQFGIETSVANVEVGSVVTRYELKPAPGIRVERISGLSRNLALALEATSVRVEAPVPGKGVVGIEIPNGTSHTVYLKSLLDGKQWKQSDAKLPMALGQDVGGDDLIADLAAMPHLLIAGQTGSGKSVCINSILTGLLMSRTPDELRLLLVDPKIVEFTAYADLPHLVVPVITDPKKVALGLRWAINEMERRYKMFAKAKVKDIASFNSRVKVQQPELFPATDEEEEQADVPEKKSMTGDDIPDRLPYIVVVIDELSDLMMVAKTDVENAVTRLAQLSRATGIHMILATQRPSVNVITGTIKTNLPARIAFKVAQRVDSRTILDRIGSEALLGRGDMLMLQPGTDKMVRAQGAMCSDEEIRRVTEFIREQGKPDYEVAIHEKLESAAVDDGVEDEEGTDPETDSKLDDAIEFIRQTKRASTSSLQRRFRIGYTRAARIVDILERRGILGPPCGSGPREILIDLDGEIPDNNMEAYEDEGDNNGTWRDIEKDED